MRISIIVPVLNEGKILRNFLGHLRQTAAGCEIVVADGNSDDASFEIAQEFADLAIRATRGRASQMNAGAASAGGEVFWFVHADSQITSASVPAIEGALMDPKTVGGCFRLRIDSPRFIYRIRDAIGNFLVNLTGVALGDRGFFCRREVFFEIGGYREVEILEDAEFYRKMKGRGRVIQLNEILRTSARRYEKLGPVMTMLFYALIMLFYVARVPSAALERMVHSYTRQRRSAQLFLKRTKLWR